MHSFGSPLQGFQGTLNHVASEARSWEMWYEAMGRDRPRRTRSLRRDDTCIF